LGRLEGQNQREGRGQGGGPTLPTIDIFVGKRPATIGKSGKEGGQKNTKTRHLTVSEVEPERRGQTEEGEKGKTKSQCFKTFHGTGRTLSAVEHSRFKVVEKRGERGGGEKGEWTRGGWKRRREGKLPFLRDGKPSWKFKAETGEIGRSERRRTPRHYEKEPGKGNSNRERKNTIG